MVGPTIPFYTNSKFSTFGSLGIGFGFISTSNSDGGGFSAGSFSIVPGVGVIFSLSDNFALGADLEYQFLQLIGEDNPDHLNLLQVKVGLVFSW